ncbi:MAG: long-chain fatty acid--CoA ligase [Alphaproteobacteria bacterium]|nr:long-chain fatty acid--CoA ligase [Alphaproteobacteria bacterium]MDP6564040.1 long-chain fatty acid--CoA ligase [Alphaproteobacteria bacterium]MDP6812237.1 long-chain fatty acid--CoA ligase [Alphaproteobacteria bacterium]
MTIISEDWIAHHARFAPEREALHDLASARCFSYAALDGRVSQAALYLRDGLGVRRGDRVAVLSHNDSDVFEIQFACRRLGAIFLPLNWRLAVPELEYICNDATPAALLHGVEFADEVAALSELCDIPAIATLNNGGDSDYETGIARAVGGIEPVERELGDTWTILYTSGTSGRPKGALITYSMALFNGLDCAMTGDLTSYSKNLVILPTFHTGGLNVWANPLFQAGGCNVVMRAFDPADLLRILGDKELCITHTLGVPTNFLMLAEEPGFAEADLSHITCLCVGGAAAPKEMIKSYNDVGVQLRAMYGMTEIGPLGLALPPEKRLEKLGSSGLPTMHTRMKICDPDGGPTPIGEVGELMIKGPSVTPGYWNRPEANAAAFTEDGWFHTGDAARQDADGFYYIVDRWKDMFISGGENVYPVEVENVIYQLNGVLENAVIGVPDEKWGEVGRAYLVLRDGANIDADAVIGHCKSQLANYKVPKQIRMIDELPHNATGKVLKHQLPTD